MNYARLYTPRRRTFKVFRPSARRTAAARAEKFIKTLGARFISAAPRPYGVAVNYYAR